MWLRSAATPRRVSDEFFVGLVEGIEPTGSTADVVKSEVGNTGVELQQQRERLANTTGGTENGDLGGLREC